MKTALSLCILWAIVSMMSCYSIQGSWRSTQYPDVSIAVTPLFTDQDGLNQYSLQIRPCSYQYQFKIVQSFVKITSLSSSFQNCASVNASQLFSRINQKIMYFQIRGEQLILISVTGSETTAFSRVAKSAINNNLQGSFRTVDNIPVWIDAGKVYLCNGALNASYSTDKVTTFQLDQNSIQNGCTQNQSQLIIDALGRGEHYRIENPTDLVFYSRDARQIKLAYFGPFNASEVVIMPTHSQQGTNDTVAADQSQQIQNQSQQNQSAQQNQTQQAQNQSTQQTNQTQQNQQNQTQNQQQSTSPQVNQTTQQNLTQDNSSQTQQTLQNTNQQNTQNTQNTQASQTQQQSSGVRAFVIQPVNLIGVWFNEYFSSADQNLWPPRTVFNGTNILFQGCNTVSIPLKIDTSLNTVTALPNSATTLTRKACGTSDQQFIDIIGSSTRVEPIANDTHLILPFYDANNHKTMATVRKLATNELSNIVFAQSSTSQGSISNSNAQSSSPNNANNQSSGQSSNTQSQTSNTQSSTSSSTQTPQSSQTSQNTSQTTTTQAPSSLSASEVQKAIVGIYNPKMLYSRSLPTPLSSTIILIFTLDSVSILGLCNTYKYPLSITDNNSVIEVSVDPSKRLVRPNKAGCDQAEDQLYLGALQYAKTTTMINQQGQILAYFFDSNGKQTLLLAKQQM